MLAVLFFSATQPSHVKQDYWLLNQDLIWSLTPSSILCFATGAACLFVSFIEMPDNLQAVALQLNASKLRTCFLRSLFVSFGDLALNCFFHCVLPRWSFLPQECLWHATVLDKKALSWAKFLLLMAEFYCKGRMGGKVEQVATSSSAGREEIPQVRAQAILVKRFLSSGSSYLLTAMFLAGFVMQNK